jgi:hypothetical protein
MTSSRMSYPAGAVLRAPVLPKTSGGGVLVKSAGLEHFDADPVIGP